MRLSSAESIQYLFSLATNTLHQENGSAYVVTKNGEIFIGNGHADIKESDRVYEGNALIAGRLYVRERRGIIVINLITGSIEYGCGIDDEKTAEAVEKFSELLEGYARVSIRS